MSSHQMFYLEGNRVGVKSCQVKFVTISEDILLKACHFKYKRLFRCINLQFEFMGSSSLPLFSS